MRTSVVDSSRTSSRYGSFRARMVSAIFSTSVERAIAHGIDVMMMSWLPRGNQDIIITSMPWAMARSTLVEKIAETILARKLPYLLDVRDESTTDVRIVLEIKKDADPELVMAYLYKNTPLQQSFHVNMT